MNTDQARYTVDVIVIATDDAGQSDNATLSFSYFSDIAVGTMPPGTTVQTTSQFQNFQYDMRVPSYRNNINNVCKPTPHF